MAKRRSFERVVFDDIEIVDIAEEGKGVAKREGLVIFVDRAIPGDIGDIEVFRKKKSFLEGRMINITKASDSRVEPFCSHFGICGGCKWQHMSYESQLKFKQQAVENALQRIGGVETSSIEPILPSANTVYYRNKLEFTFSNKRWLTDLSQGIDADELPALGFHVPRRFDKILQIDHCYLQEDPSNAIRNEVDRFAKQNLISYYDIREHTGSLRNLIIRTSSTGEIMVVVAFAYASPEEIEALMSHLASNFPQITSLMYVINQKKNDTIFDLDVMLYRGRDYIQEKMEGLYFKIGPKSFYQTNSLQAYELYKITRDYANLSGDELVYDLYTGAGTIANFVASQARKVIGIEYVPTAIEDAKFNSEYNNVDNTEFFAGDMKDVLTADFVQEHGVPDVIITDPPRAGMHPAVVDRILEIAAKKIVYVSCNASTQARDIAVLSQKYTVSRIRPVDMFPHTQHVENVVLLELI